MAMSLQQILFSLQSKKTANLNFSSLTNWNPILNLAFFQALVFSSFANFYESLIWKWDFFKAALDDEENILWCPFFRQKNAKAPKLFRFSSFLHWKVCKHSFGSFGRFSKKNHLFFFLVFETIQHCGTLWTFLEQLPLFVYTLLVLSCIL